MQSSSRSLSAHRLLPRAAGRVFRAPGLLLSIILLHLALGMFVGQSVRAMVGAGMGSFAIFADGRLMYHLIQILVENQGMMPGLMHVTMGSAILGVIFWMVLAAGVIARLNGKISLTKTVATGVQHLPSMLVITLWHLIPKAIFLGICAFATTKVLDKGYWGLVGIAGTLLVLAITTCALDLSRCAVVLHGARRFSIRTAWRGYRQAFRRRGVLLASVAASLGQWICVVAMLWIGLRHPESGATIWAVRALSATAVFLVLTRIAVAALAGPR